VPGQPQLLRYLCHSERQVQVRTESIEIQEPQHIPQHLATRSRS